MYLGFIMTWLIWQLLVVLPLLLYGFCSVFLNNFIFFLFYGFVVFKVLNHLRLVDGLVKVPDVFQLFFTFCQVGHFDGFLVLFFNFLINWFSLLYFFNFFLSLIIKFLPLFLPLFNFRI